MVDTDLRDAAARRLGMKPSEIVDVVEYDNENAVLVTTHDGVQTRVDEHGAHVVSTPAAVSRNPATGEVSPTVGEQAVADAAEMLEDGTEPCPECLGTGRRPIADHMVGDEDEGGDDVPDGNADEVLAWVGSDPQRALAALEAEQGREKPRSGLTGHLEKVIADAKVSEQR